jgi:sugar/nucleoside kinase (ribokinase family)
LVRDSRTWITISQAQKVITFVAREEVPPEQEETALAAVARLVDEVDGLYLTVEDPRILRAALEGARARGLPVALNASIPLLELLLPGHRDLLVDLVATSDVVLCNHREGPRFLAALKVDEWSAAPGPARREVVVTEGEAGGRFREGDLGDWTSFEAVAPESIRCVVGAGDTFNGGYLVARWGGGATVAQSCRRGAELAARKVAVRSSMLPSGQPTSAS